MASFLSAGWISELDHVVSRSETLRESTRDRRFVLQQTVERAPNDRVVYHVDLDHGRAAARAGEAADPDVRFRTDYATAVAISRGRDSAQAAFMRGRLQVGGDMGALLRNSDLFAVIDDVFASVRARTSY